MTTIRIAILQHPETIRRALPRVQPIVLMAMAPPWVPAAAVMRWRQPVAVIAVRKVPVVPNQVGILPNQMMLQPALTTVGLRRAAQ